MFRKIVLSLFVFAFVGIGGFSMFAKSASAFVVWANYGGGSRCWSYTQNANGQWSGSTVANNLCGHLTAGPGGISPDQANALAKAGVTDSQIQTVINTLDLVVYSAVTPTTITTTTTSSTTPFATIRLGSTGYWVSQAQIALKNKGFYSGNIDGKAGPLFVKAVTDYQVSVGASADGLLGKGTARLLGLPIDEMLPYNAGATVNGAINIGGGTPPLLPGGPISMPTIPVGQVGICGTGQQWSWSAGGCIPVLVAMSSDDLFRIVSQGATGPDVVWLQNALIAKGYLSIGSADGKFGLKTFTALTLFQKSVGLTANGFAGVDTFAALGLKSQMPSTDTAVPQSQTTTTTRTTTTSTAPTNTTPAKTVAQAYVWGCNQSALECYKAYQATNGLYYPSDYVNVGSSSCVNAPAKNAQPACSGTQTAPANTKTQSTTTTQTR